MNAKTKKNGRQASWTCLMCKEHFKKPGMASMPWKQSREEGVSWRNSVVWITFRAIKQRLILFIIGKGCNDRAITSLSFHG